MLNLAQIRVEGLAESIFCQAMSRMWAPLEFELLRLERPPEPDGPAAVEYVEISVSGTLYGHIRVTGDQGGLTEERRVLIRNAVRMLGVILEKNDQERQLQRHHNHLEVEVLRRTEELDRSNRRLKFITESTSRLAGCLDFQTLGRSLLETFAHILKATGGSFYYNDGETLRLIHRIGAVRAPEVLPLPPGEWSGEANDSAFVYPLLDNEGRVLGLVSLDCPDGVEPTDLDKEMGAIIGSYADEALRAIVYLTRLKTSEERYRSLYEQAGEGIILNDMDMNIVDANPRALEILGYSHSELVGLHLGDLLHPDDLKAAPVESIQRRVLDGDNVSIERRYRGASGQYIPVQVTVSFMPNTGLNQVFIQDISERKRAEEERERLVAQLQQSQKMEAIGTLAGGVAHDFNNLLQAINGYTQLLLLAKEANNPDRPSLKEIEKACARAGQLVKQLLLFSRKVEAEPRPLNLNEEVGQAGRMLERTIPKMIEIEIHPERRLWTVQADPVQIEQALLNLGGNAADAMPDGGRLVIETQNVVLDEEYARGHPGASPGNYVLLTVSDTGCGMDQETLEHIFDPFFTTKEFGRGTGLGLASVYGIVKGHGGYIMCCSEPGQGTTFKIFLPGLEQNAGDVSGRELEDEPEGGTETILLVDDEAPIRDFATHVLGHFGYRIVTASNGREALEIYADQKDRIDLVILDIGMPVMGGYQCLQGLRQANPAGKVLIASGYSINGQAKKALEAGALGFIPKPYQVKDLLARVRRALDQEV